MILAQFHYQKHFLKIQFKYVQIQHDLDYHSTEFHSSRIFETCHFIRFGSYSQSQDLITFCRPGSSLKILAQFHYQKYFLKIQFKYDQILHDLDYHPIEFHSCGLFCRRLEIILKLGHFIRFVSYSQSQDLADPVQVLRSSLNFIIRNIF